MLCESVVTSKCKQSNIKFISTLMLYSLWHLVHIGEGKKCEHIGIYGLARKKKQIKAERTTYLPTLKVAAIM